MLKKSPQKFIYLASSKLKCFDIIMEQNYKYSFKNIFCSWLLALYWIMNELYIFVSYKKVNYVPLVQYKCSLERPLPPAWSQLWVAAPSYVLSLSDLTAVLPLQTSYCSSAAPAWEWIVSELISRNHYKACVWLSRCFVTLQGVCAPNNCDNYYLICWQSVSALLTSHSNTAQWPNTGVRMS